MLANSSNVPAPLAEQAHQPHSFLSRTRIRRAADGDTAVESGYTSMPEVREMVEYLTQRSTPDSRATRFARGLTMTNWACLTALGAACCYGLIMKSIPTPLAMLGIGSLLLCVFISLFLPVFQAIRQKDMFTRPGRFLATQLDEQLACEIKFAARLKTIPKKVLTERLTRVDSQIAALEKWIDVARVIWILGPVVVLLFKSGFQVSDSVNELIQMVVCALSVGVLFGAAQTRAGLLDLHRVSCVLKLAVEADKDKPQLRKISRKRRTPT